MKHFERLRGLDESTLANAVEKSGWDFGKGTEDFLNEVAAFRKLHAELSAWRTFSEELQAADPSSASLLAREAAELAGRQEAIQGHILQCFDKSERVSLRGEDPHEVVLEVRAR